MFPAVLLVIVWPQLQRRSALVMALTAVVAALALLEPTPGGVPVLVAAAASLFALVERESAASGDAQGTEPC